MPMTPREMIKHLKKNGFEEVSQNGSHVKLRNPETVKTGIVPYHSKAMKKGLEQGLSLIHIQMCIRDRGRYESDLFEPVYGSEKV